VPIPRCSCCCIRSHHCKVQRKRCLWGAPGSSWNPGAGVYNQNEPGWDAQAQCSSVSCFMKWIWMLWQVWILHCFPKQIRQSVLSLVNSLLSRKMPLPIFFPSANFLYKFLAYENCTKRSHCDISIRVYNLLWLNWPPLSLFLNPLPLPVMFIILEI
jgi:hypothetical protein